MTRDDRTAAEKAAWDAGRFTEEEAAGGGVTVEELNRVREQEERDAGNPLAPPS